MSPEWKAVADSCLRRIRTWQAPPNFAARDWREEIEALANAAAWQAVCDYDPSFGVPLGAFVRQRVMTCALTRFRQEWAYARRCVDDAPEEDLGSEADDTPSVSMMTEALWYALAWLPEADRQLIERLFWEGCTEAEVAKATGVCRQRVSQRKRVILQELREWLEGPEETWKRVAGTGSKNRLSLHIY
jgi:RNA polymerase sigma factor (sigma-70 family)